MKTKFAVRIKDTGSSWAAGIHQMRSKKEAIRFAIGVGKTGGFAEVVKKSEKTNWKWV